MAKKKSDHYIDIAQFFEEMKAWKTLVKAAEKEGKPHPPVTTYIGECFMAIADRLSRKPNFINYPYREEMISDGIENCLLYAYNFNPRKSKNPFSYFTKVAYHAFQNCIKKSKKDFDTLRRYQEEMYESYICSEGIPYKKFNNLTDDSYYDASAAED